MTLTVESRHLTSAYEGAPEVDVVATPALVHLIERVCSDLLQPALRASQTSVGVRVEIDHVGVAYLGDQLHLEAEADTVFGRRVRFRVVARGPHGAVGLGEHERVVVDRERFRARAGAATR